MMVKCYKRTMLLIVFVIVCNSLAGCYFSGKMNQDLEESYWIYDLPHGYTLTCGYPDDICILSLRMIPDLSRGYGTTNIAVNNYITHFCYGGDYIAAKRVDPMYLDDDYNVNYEQATIEYFLINAYSDFFYGPFVTENDFLKACEEWGVDSLCEWISTVPMPEGAQK